MPGELVPYPPSSDVAERTAFSPPGWASGPMAAAPAAPPVRGNRLARYKAALGRYKWVMLPIVLLGTVAGVIATRFIQPDYEAQARVWISAGDDANNAETKQGPIRADEIVHNAAWIELLKSYRISDSVAVKLGLFATPKKARDSVVLHGLQLGSRFRPGRYELDVDARRGRYLLATSSGQPVDSGAVGDSIGRNIGLRWAPTPAVLQGRNQVEFTLVTPREASVGIARHLTAQIPENTNFLYLVYKDKDPQMAAAVLNTWLDEFMKVAAELKRAKLKEFADTLQTQLATAAQQLAVEEGGLQRFKVGVITKPSENVPIAPGVTEIRDPVLGSFFEQKVELERTTRDREALEAALQQFRSGNNSTTSLMGILSISNSPAASSLRGSIERLDSAKTALSSLRQQYTDDFPKVKETIQTVNRLQNQDIPQMARQYAAQLRTQENELRRRIAGATAELEQMPARTIEESRRNRNVAVQADLYVALQQRYASARLAEKSAIPDVRVLDRAIAPLEPSSNTAPVLIAGAILGSLALSILVALILDHTDRRIRYPEQAVNDLGLTVLGAVPDLRRRLSGDEDPEETAQVVEAFRSIRLNVRHAFDVGPIMVTISSPGAGEGKSLVASNLALSFAEAGYRTVLVDGDTRRGQLHTSFGVPQRPGLIDLLAGAASDDDIVVPTTHDNLALIPCGARRRQGPELLSSVAMEQLVARLKREYDVILFDSPPLAAGIDAFALGTVSGHMVMVLRVGRTDRRLAEAKLALLDRFPVHVLGAVMNDVKLSGEYEYYSYLEGYSVGHDDAMPRLRAGGEVHPEEEEVGGAV
jgi:capsular exopolysaccharide synthesis family protein